MILTFINSFNIEYIESRKVNDSNIARHRERIKGVIYVFHPELWPRNYTVWGSTPGAGESR